MRPLNLFILDTHPIAELGPHLRACLEPSPHLHVDVHAAESIPEAPTALLASICSNKSFDRADIVFVIAPACKRESTLALITSIAERRKGLPIIVVSRANDAVEVLEYLRSGAIDHLTPPIRDVDVLPRIWRIMDHHQDRRSLIHKLKTNIGLRQLIGASPAFQKVVEALPTVAKSDVSVRISGETGTGKELCARAIHYLGPRADRAFMPVNCGAIPAELVENELFGHVRGAFTGANLSHGGLINEANGGTLFLDEIDCLPMTAQTKLLRFAQEKEFRQLGSTRVKRADVRIVVATNSDLELSVKTGSFRSDLFYRLNTVHLALPALRERRDDIPLLARHFLEQNAVDAGKEIRDFSPAALDLLCAYRWPGNVRELENVVKRAVLFARRHELDAGDIDLPISAAANSRASFKEKKASVVAEFEREYMKDLLRTYEGNITRAAKAAQKNRRAFWELLRKYDIDVTIFKHPPAE